MSDDQFEIVFEKLEEEIKKQNYDDNFQLMEISDKVKDMREIINEISTEEEIYYTKAGY